MMYFLLNIMLLIRSGNSLDVGDRCTEQHTNTEGVCTPTEQCNTAREDYEQNGISPTICGLVADKPVVCCKDNIPIFKNDPEETVVWRAFTGNTDSEKSEITVVSCVEKHTGTRGVCTPAANCQSVREDYLNNGIKPTFCTGNPDDPVVCCKDGVPIFQAAHPVIKHKPEKMDNPIYSPEDGRISVKKCEEYSQLAGVNNFNNLPLIIGGELAKNAEFPHMAAIGWLDDDGYAFKCGGSLISRRFVLTAAHCTWNPYTRSPKPAIVRLGAKNLDPDEAADDEADSVDIDIKTIHTHPEYASPVRYHDIALLELASDVTLTQHIRPACLWSKSMMAGHRTAIASGWGVTDARAKETSKNLLKVTLDLLDDFYCQQLLGVKKRNWPDGFIPLQLCAGDLSGGRDTCQGDSGAPLQVLSCGKECVYHVVGITSFGFGCAERSKPAIYTRVSGYIDWIESIVWPEP